MMKKLVSVALVLVMVFALAISAAANDSPRAKEYYNITVDSEGSGTGSADKNKVEKDAEGDEGIVTLTATEADGFFTLWIIDGDFEIVSGDLSSPVLQIRPKSDINAIASFSVEEDFLTIFVDAETIGDGKATVDKAKVEKGSNDVVTLTAVEDNDLFVEWILACKYDIVEGSLTSKTLVIRPYTDIHATAKFSTNGATEATTATENQNTGSTSPKTGDPIFFVIGFALLMLGAGAYTVKRIRE